MTRCQIVLPARLASTRLPEKLLRQVGGKSILQHTYEAASRASAAEGIVIAVDDVKESIKKVTDAGGKMLGEPMKIPGVGQYVSFIDSEGNRVSMLQPVPRNWHDPKSVPKS